MKIKILTVALILNSFTINSCVSSPSWAEKTNQNFKQVEDEFRQFTKETTNSLVESKKEFQRQVDILKDQMETFKKQSLRSAKVSAPSQEGDTLTSDRLTSLEKAIQDLQKKIHTLELADKGKDYQIIPTISTLPIKDWKKRLSTLLQDKKIPELIELATQGIESFTAPSELHKIALQYRAEAYFQSKNYPLSIVDFLNYEELYPSSDRIPRFYLLLGDSYIYLKDFTRAKNYYSLCFKNFPSKKEGIASNERLQKLNP